jgi:hypothetical protein
MVHGTPHAFLITLCTIYYTTVYFRFTHTPLTFSRLDVCLEVVFKTYLFRRN